MCVGRGGSSDFFQSKLKLSEIPGGYNICYPGGGGGGRGRQTFFKGDGVQLLRDKTYDLYWIPVPPLDPRIYHKF